MENMSLMGIDDEYINITICITFNYAAYLVFDTLFVLK